jgi:predicted permease
MSLIKRFTNSIFRHQRVDREVQQELASHLEEAVEQGRTPAEARRVFGSELLQRERTRDTKFLPWLEALTSDIVFCWRQFRKRPGVSLTATLSLAIAIGATTAAYRLVDAVLYRTLPVAAPEPLSFLAETSVDEGHPDYRDDFDYPTFRQYRDAVANQADLMVIGGNHRQVATFDGGVESEKVVLQFISGNAFGVFALQPELGRLLAPYDDLTPGGHPVAVLSDDYWNRRFARNPNVLGKTVRMGNGRYQIVGVTPRGFTGTEPGAVTDIFVPAMMNTEAINSPGWSWFRIWLQPKQGFTAEQVRQSLQVLLTRDRQQRLTQLHSDAPKATIDSFLSARLFLLPAAAGVSDIQKEYRRPLFILAGFVVLVLLIACSNVGNLMAAQATSRAREMALRVSIGAGRWRLIQLVLVESALLAAAASALGTLFASWSAPIVVSMMHVPEDPVRLVLDSGWRGMAFSVLLASAVALLFGVAPALRASAVKPVNALKGGDEAKSGRGMHSLLAAQMAFCVLVLFVAGLFVATFERLSNRPLGFSSDHVLVMDAAAPNEQPLKAWIQAADQLRASPGVESVGMAGWPLLSRNRWTTDVRIPGRPFEGRTSYALDVSPAFFETMHIGMIDGRDFRETDSPPRLDASKRPVGGVGIVNEAFTRAFFSGQNPIRRTVSLSQGKDVAAPMEIIGYVKDAVYYDVRETMHPTIYLPMAQRNFNTFFVRTTGDPMLLAPTIQHLASKSGGLQVHTVQTQNAFFRWQTLRERLLASLALFFSVVALVLAAVGLYGVLNYSVTRQTRQIGIRMALGATPARVVRRITAGLFGMVTLGLVVGLTGGLACGRLLESFLFGVRATDAGAILAPLAALVATALLAALPPAIRAARVDPAQTLRSE